MDAVNRGAANLGAANHVTSLRRTPQQARSQARISRALEAADRLLAREGAEALSTTGIAKEAGISVGSLYQYFPDKGAIIDALARHYLSEFEGLMDELGRRAEAEAWPDPVGTLIDSYAEHYRIRPGFRALWFGRHLTEELRATDRRHKLTMAEGVRRILLARGAAHDDAHLATVCRAAVLTADSLLQDAFRTEPDGDAALIEETKTILRHYLAAVTVHYGTRKGSP